MASLDLSGIITRVCSNLKTKFEERFAPILHAHGNITNGGAISTDTSIENGDRLVFSDVSDTAKIKRSVLAFGSSTTMYLRNDGTWATPAGGSGGNEMVVLTYGNSTWADFEAAYNTNSIVYCRASGNANPGVAPFQRMAFMAYVNANPPTSVEFQYYRSISSHSASQQGDQVFIYKLDKTNGWSVTSREASTKIVAGNGLTQTYSSGTLTISASTPQQVVVSTTTPSDSNTMIWIDPSGTGVNAAAGVSF